MSTKDFVKKEEGLKNKFKEKLRIYGYRQMKKCHFANFVTSRHI